ncbi:RTA1 like protein-domain-containing protein [Aspergillus karnatakaensis]|uniref:RTA1 domain-containing protein n=1 Tax=Aspergillus karnatakaensis TaxID=1810916 RepID=UPI003CCDA321
MTYQLYNDKPSMLPAIVFGILFAITTLVHIWQAIRTRSWFLTPIILGGLFEVAGYFCRVLSGTERDDWTTDPAAAQSVLIVLGPLLFTASIILLFNRIVHALKASSVSIIRPNWLTRIFLAGVIVSFIIQGGGGIMLLQSEDSERASLGSRIIFLGLLVQILFLLLYIIPTSIFHRRMLRTPLHQSNTEITIPWQKYMTLLHSTVGLILVRTVFRAVEFGQGADGALRNKEAFIYIFDGILMLAGWIIFNIWHPGMMFNAWGRAVAFQRAAVGELEMGVVERGSVARG